MTINRPLAAAPFLFSTTLLTLALSATLLPAQSTKEATGKSVEQGNQDQSNQLFVESACEKLVEGLIAEDETKRRETIRGVLPEESDFITLFGEQKGKTAFRQIEPHFKKMIDANEQVRLEFTSKGKLNGIEAQDLRKLQGKQAEIYKDLLETIPADIPVYSIVQQWEDGAAGSSCYLIIDKRLVLIRGLEQVPAFLKTQRKKDK